MQRQLIKTITVLFFIFILISCATGSSIITGTVRPAIDPTVVKIYNDLLPSQYETIGIIEVSRNIESAAQERVINQLKLQAAKIGANGIILGKIGANSRGVVGVYSNGVFIPTESETRLIQARAIYVTQE